MCVNDLVFSFWRKQIEIHRLHKMPNTFPTSLTSVLYDKGRFLVKSLSEHTKGTEYSILLSALSLNVWIHLSSTTRVYIEILEHKVLPGFKLIFVLSSFLPLFQGLLHAPRVMPIQFMSQHNIPVV